MAADYLDTFGPLRTNYIHGKMSNRWSTFGCIGCSSSTETQFSEDPVKCRLENAILAEDFSVNVQPRGGLGDITGRIDAAH